MRIAFAGMLWTVLLAGQTAVEGPSLELSLRLRQALDAGDWRTAAELSRQLQSRSVALLDRRERLVNDRQMYEVLEALPQEIDLLVVAPGASLLPAAGSARLSFPSIQGAIAHLSTGMFDNVAGGKLRREGGALRFAVTAIRTSPFQACSLFGTEVPVTRMDFGVDEDAIVLAHPVWTSTGERFAHWGLQEVPAETFYTTIIWPRLILTCNHKDLFRSVLSGGRAASSSRGIVVSKWSWSGDLPRFPEVKRVDWKSASLWAVRHFSGPRDAEDAKDPRNLMKAGDDQASGVGLEIGRLDGGMRAIWFTGGTRHSWEALEIPPKPAGVAIRKVEGGWALSTKSQNEDRKLAGVLLAALLGLRAF